jgi:hypothetical protein
VPSAVGEPVAVVDGNGLAAVVDGNGLVAMLGAGTSGIGLTPPLPISKEPNGIPVRGAPPGVVGDVAANVEALLPEVVPHGADIAVLPGIDIPVPMPIPPPSKVVLEPDIPDVVLPVTVHGVPLAVIPTVPLGSGLTPPVASPVAPKGIPVGGTCEPGIMPSGEVAPMLGVGLPIPPTCAKAEPQPKRIATAETITKRVIPGLTFSSEFVVRGPRRTKSTSM